MTRFVPQITKIVEALPLDLLGPVTGKSVKSIFKAAAAWVSRIEQDRSAYLIECLSDEFRRFRGKLEDLAEDHQNFVREEFLPLVVDGLQKAEQTRSRERIKRIAAILANALEIGPGRAVDVTEELMRIAANLADEDVAVLRHLVDGQRGFYNPKVGRPAFHEVNKYWTAANNLGQPVPESAPAFKLGISEGQLQVACAKLQSFGLVSQSESIGIPRQPGFQPFAILPRAIEFVDSIKALASNQAHS
jgi:hypothetical protein